MTTTTLRPTVVRFNGDGTPNIDHLEHDTIGSHAIDYMHRYFIHRDHDTGATQLHHILTDDLYPDPHDHPWDFTSILLTGAYRDIGPAATDEYHAPCVITRRAEHVHRLELLDGPMWTVVVAGPVRRQWGYHTQGGWIPWRSYRGST